jgi:WD40 repeat protein
VSVSAENGTPPYHFELVGAPAGVSLEEDGTGATLHGTFADANDYSVTVRATDSDGRTGARTTTLHVHDTPVVATTTLPDACPDQVYAAPLSATGGEGDYTFTIDVDPATGLSGIADEVTGHFVNTTGQSGSVAVHVTATSRGCTSAPATLTLPQNSLGNPACAQLSIVANPDVDVAPGLPAPCAGYAYDASFAVRAGVPGYTWQAVATPPGLSFDPDSRVLSGTPATDLTGKSSVTLQVTDGVGRTIESSFQLGAPRAQCWLAYLAPSTGSTALNLFDPVLDHRQQFPSDPGNNPVLDFKFSPDGRWLAYRTGTDPTAAGLSLLEMTTFREQSFDFEAVGHYSWSDDANTLAVGFATDQGTFLGGVDMSAGAGNGATLAFPELVPVAAQVDTDPIWFAGSNVAFFARLDVDYNVLTTTARTGTGFLDPVLSDDAYSDLTHLRAAPAGVFVLPDPKLRINYYPDDGSSAVGHGPKALIAPNGRFVADVLTSTPTDGTLEIYQPANTSFAKVHATTPDQSSAGCLALLGWAPDGSEVVCAEGESSSEAQLNIFNIDGQTKAIPAPLIVRGVYDFPALGQTGLARLFSPSGDRLAFMSGNTLYATPIAAGGTTVDLTFPFNSAPGGTDVVLGFSPDGRFLLAHRGSTLNLFDFRLPQNQLPSFLHNDEAVASAPACDEDFQAPPGDYCGESRTHMSFAWSPDSRLVAVATSTGALLVKDLNYVEQGTILTVSASSECTSCTAGDQFAFQP